MFFRLFLITIFIGIGYVCYNLYSNESQDSFPKLKGIYGGQIVVNKKEYQVLVDAEQESIYRFTIFDISEKIQDLRYESNSYLTIKLEDLRYSLIGKCVEKICSGNVLNNDLIVGSWKLASSVEMPAVKMKSDKIVEWQQQVDSFRILEEELTKKRLEFSELQNDFDDYQEMIGSGLDLKEASKNKSVEYDNQISQAVSLIEVTKKNISDLSEQLRRQSLLSQAGILLTKSREFLKSQKEVLANEGELNPATDPSVSPSPAIKDLKALPMPKQPKKQDFSEEQP